MRCGMGPVVIDAAIVKVEYAWVAQPTRGVNLGPASADTY
jgi:hypothetical protein